MRTLHFSCGKNHTVPGTVTEENNRTSGTTGGVEILSCGRNLQSQPEDRNTTRATWFQNNRFNRIC